MAVLLFLDRQESCHNIRIDTSKVPIQKWDRLYAKLGEIIFVTE